MATVQGEEQKRIGGLIRVYRKHKNMTQTDLGVLLNLGTKAISDYEKGHIKVIPFEKRVKLSDVLDIPIVELLYNDEKTNRKNHEITVQYIDNVKDIGEKEIDNLVNIIHSSEWAQFRESILKSCRELPLGKSVELIFKEINNDDVYYGDIDFLQTTLKELFESRGMSEEDAESLSSYFCTLYLELFDC